MMSLFFSWVGCSWKDNHPLQTEARRNCYYHPHNRYVQFQSGTIAKVVIQFLIGYCNRSSVSPSVVHRIGSISRPKCVQIRHKYCVNCLLRIPLPIETGRWTRIERERRLCPCRQIQTELHVLVHCPLAEFY